MRDDMAKVVTERPRRGHANKSKKTALRLDRNARDRAADALVNDDTDDDFGPSRAPVGAHRQHGWDAKEFSDLLGPLRRYMKSVVGQHWDKVFSELSQKLDRRGTSGSHIWDHVMQEIELDCYVGEDRLVYSNDRKFMSWGMKDYPVDGLYVCPKTRIIKEQRRPTSRSRRYSKEYAFARKLSVYGHHKSECTPRYAYRVDGTIPCLRSHFVSKRLQDFRIDADTLTVWERRDGQWFIHTFEKLPEMFVLYHSTRADGTKIPYYAGPGAIRCINVKQAGRKEIQRARPILEKEPF